MAEIVIDDLTTRTLEGTGVFDSLMTANRIRLDREFDKTRIKGPDYSKVYLGGMEAAMQQSIIYLLGRQKADKEAELIDEQILKTIAEVILIGKQGQKLDAETDLLVDQLLTESKKRDQMDSEIALTDQKTLTEIQNTLLVTAKTATEGAQKDLLVEQLLTEALKRDLMAEQISIAQQELLIKQQQLLIEQEKLKLTEAQTWAEKAKTTGDLTDTTGTADLLNAGGLFGGQLEKLTQEGALLTQKVATETAQTVGTTTSITGVLGKQMGLYQKQTDGFDRDSEQKLAKIYADTLNTEIVSIEDATPGSAGFSDAEIKTGIELALAGVQSQ